VSRRTLSMILTSITIAVALVSCSGDGGHSTSSPKPTTTASAAPTSTTPIAPEPASEDKLEVKTFNVAPWGEKVYNQDHTLSLQAKGHEFGDNASVSSYKLCAEIADGVPLTDTGYGNSPVQVMGVPKLGEVLTVQQQAYPPKHFITIDDSQVTLVADNGGERLERLLLDNGYNGGCTDLKVEMLTGDNRIAVVGFAHTTIPFGEWRPDGGFTWAGPTVSEDVEKATSIYYQFFVN